MRKYREYSNDDIVKYAAEVKSIAGLLKKLDLKVAGGNYSNIKRRIQQLNIDTSHWTGMGWNNGQQLKDWSEYTRGRGVKPHLIKIRGNICEECGLMEWLGKSIKLELHHLDGDRTYNKPENLQLLCPNCHSFTDTWRKSNSH